MEIIVILPVLLVFILLVLVLLYNRLIKLRNNVENGWSQIDVQLQRRYDLIPNLVETVKGYAAHEASTLEAVTNARSQAQQAQGPAEKAEAENMLTGTLKTLFAVSEAYPDLKANENFLALQEELTATEGRVAYARQYYNESVQNYNTAIQQVPGNLIAGPFGFTKRDFFEIDGPPETRQAVKVDF